MASVDNSEPGAKGALMLEALLLPEATRLENLPAGKKDVLCKGQATTIVLW